jgi:hypothetical protein
MSGGTKAPSSKLKAQSSKEVPGTEAALSQRGVRDSIGHPMKPVINIQEKIGKVVGTRQPPADAFKAGMGLQALEAELHNTFKHRWAARGIYRFKTHEEADEWMRKMLARSQTPNP